MELFFAILIHIRHIISPNLDMFFIMSIFFIIYDLYKNKFMVGKKVLIIVLICYLFSIIQLSLNKYYTFTYHNLNILKYWVNFHKIILCYYIFKFVQYNLYKLNLKKLILEICKVYSILLGISIVFYNGKLWRIGDSSNIYRKRALQLLSNEPSALAFELSIVFIFILYYILYNSEVLTRKEKRYFYIYFCVILILIFMTKSFTGYLGIIIAIAPMVLKKYKNKITMKKVIVIYFFLISIIFILILLVMNDSTIVLRTIDIFTGKDSSVNYRIYVGYTVMRKILSETSYLGIGFGNLSTEPIRYIFRHLGVEGNIIANSFMYFISETGLFGILYITILIMYLWKKSKLNNIELRETLLFFLVINQIPGGFFTDTLIWIIYGVIASKQLKT